MRSALFLMMLAACGGAQPSRTIPAPPATTSEAPPPEVAKAEPVKEVPVAKPTKVRSVEGITEYSFPNGLQVLLYPDETQSNVTVNVTYDVGSRLEGYGETGMAHLLEHMMFKGTKRHRNVMKLLEERGAQMNGSTWMDRTNYYETLPAEGDNLAWALDLEADRMVNAEISADDLKTEFSVVRNEFEMGENQPTQVLQERVASTAYLWHNYGKDTIGSRTDIERVPIPALRAFYEKYYQPDNATLIIAGKFDDAQALDLIGKSFGALPRPTRKLQPTYTTEPQQDGERTVTLRRNGDVSAVALAYHTVGAASVDYAAVIAAMDILEREPSGRLYKKLVATKLASSISASQELFRDPYLATFVAEIRDAKNVAKVEKIMTDEFEKLGSSKIEPKELERWRVETLKNLELAFASSQLIAVELSEFIGLGDWRAIFAYRNAVEKITVDDVSRVAKTYFKPNNRTSGRFIPTKDADRAPLTETPDLQAFVKGIEGGDVKDKGEVFAANLDNIEKRTTRTTLPSGIKAALLQKKTRGAKVELRLAMHWGDEKSLQGKEVIADLAASLLQRGTKKKSYQDLRDEENLARARIWVGGSATGWTLGIETLHDKLPAALDLAAEMLRSPSFPANELELVKEEEIAQLEQRLQDPESIAFQVQSQLGTGWSKGDIRYPMTTEERLAAVKKVSVADIQAFYRDFVGANHAELSVVGDFDPAATTAQVDKLFGGWASKKPYTRVLDKAFGKPGVQKSVLVKDKEMSMLAIGMDLPMKDTDADYAAWLLVGQVLGGDTGSRIWMRVREKEGLSYGAGAWTFAGVDEETGGVGGYAIVAPQNLAQAKASIIDEFTKMTTGTITEDELARAKSAWIKGDDTNLSNDNWLVESLASQAFHGRTTEYRKNLREKIQSLTAAEVSAAAKKYIKPEMLIVVDAGDSTKAPAK